MFELLTLFLFYFLLGNLVNNFLSYRKSINVLSTITILTSIGIINSLLFLDFQNCLLWTLCVLGNLMCPSFPLRYSLIPFFIVVAVISILVIIRKNINFDHREFFKLNFSRLFILFPLTCLAIIFLYISNYSTSPITDTALFLELARSMVSYGRIDSKITLHPTLIYYNSIDPPHLYVALYYSQFMALLGSSYQTAKVANIFLSLLTLLLLSSYIYLLTTKDKHGIIPLILILITPRLWTFGAFPLAGSEILASFEFLTLLFIFEVVDLRGSRPRALFNYFVVASILYAILRTRIDYFAFFASTFVAYWLALKFYKQVSKRAAVFFFSFISLISVLLLIRFSEITLSPVLSLMIIMLWIVLITMITATVVIGVTHKKKSWIWIRFALLLLLLLILATPLIIGVNINKAFRVTTEDVKPVVHEKLFFERLDKLAFIKTYSLEEFSNRVRIFSDKALNSLPFGIFLLSLFSLGANLRSQSEYNEKMTLLVPPIFLSIFFYVLFLSASIIDYPQGFDKHRFFLICYLLMICFQSFSLAVFPTDMFKKRIKIIIAIILPLLMISALHDFPMQIRFSQEPYEVAKQMNFVEHLKTAYSWVKNNTCPDDVIFVRKLFETAWYTRRKTFFVPEGFDKDESLKQLLMKFNITYVIVDKYLPLYSELWQNLYEGVHPDFLQPVFRYKAHDGSDVWIYRFILEGRNSGEECSK